MRRSIRTSLRRAAVVFVAVVTSLLVAPPALGGDVSVQDARGDMWFIEEGSTGADIACNLNHRVNYRKNTVRLSIPRRCLNTPRTLRFGQLSEFSKRSLRFARLDNALSRQVSRRTWTGWVRRG